MIEVFCCTHKNGIILSTAVTRFLFSVLIIFMSLNVNFSRAGSSDSIIEKALSLTLLTTNQAISPDVIRLQRKMTQEITKAAYGDALAIVVPGLEHSSNSFLLQMYLAMILGDYAVQVAPPLNLQRKLTWIQL